MPSLLEMFTNAFKPVLSAFQSRTIPKETTTQEPPTKKYRTDSKNFEAETPLHSTADNGVEASQGTRTYYTDYYELRDGKYILGASKMMTAFDHSPTILIFTKFRNFTAPCLEEVYENNVFRVIKEHRNNDLKGVVYLYRY